MLQHVYLILFMIVSLPNYENRIFNNTIDFKISTG
jgi:hypothetical protein